jgi:hypothetical protein
MLFFRMLGKGTAIACAAAALTLVAGQATAVAARDAVPQTGRATLAPSGCQGFGITLTQRGLHRDGRTLYAVQGQENINLTARITSERFDTVAWYVTKDGVLTELSPATTDNDPYNY